MGDRAQVTVVFDDGSLISSFTSVNLRRTYTDPLDHLVLETAPSVEDGTYAVYKQKLGKGEKITLFINDVLQGDYLVCTSDRSISKGKGPRIKATCKNLLCTTHEGGVDPDISISPSGDMPISVFLLKVFGPYGFSGVADNAFANTSIQSGKPLKPTAASAYDVLGTLKAGEATAHDGESAYKFASRLVNRLGFAIHLTADNKILIDRPDYTQDTIATVVALSRGTAYPLADYMHGEIEVHETNDGQYSQIEVRGQPTEQTLSSGAATARPATIFQAIGLISKLCAYRSTWAPYKPFWLKDKSSGSNAHTANICCLEMGMRAKDAFKVKGSVNGWVSATGAIWTPGTMVRLVHELEEIDEPFFVLEADRSLDEHGEQVKLDLIPAGALLLGKPNA